MDDWDTVTKIGSRSAEGSKRETVVRGKGALNAAQRAGKIVATEKKYASSNASNTGQEGQRLTKVARSDDIVAPQKLDWKIAEAIKNRRAQEGFKLTQAQLAQKVNVSANDIKLLESGNAIKNQVLLNRVCKVLEIRSKTGEPLVKRGAK